MKVMFYLELMLLVLEIRMLAHYMNDEDYTNEIINGDIHTSNQKLAQLESRDKAKTFIYALMYGAGDEKLGSVVGGTTADGKQLDNISLIINHHLNLLEIEYKEHQQKVISKD